MEAPEHFMLEVWRETVAHASADDEHRYFLAA